VAARGWSGSGPTRGGASPGLSSDANDWERRGDTGGGESPGSSDA
jgi:hypothetical protein